jgi:DNA polymerase lambda
VYGLVADKNGRAASFSQFNRAMRLKANKMGYSLNQRGLWSGVTRDPRNRMVKLDRGSIIASETEEEIFKILGVPWQEPHERVRSK